ncbi:glycosyltransferase [Phreatobacter sp. AB_2022a]|uniref:glycosyltransferase n=1 Tax=Phreatobacter sp. AB_2022a TaxID=3003134 RepID=UPI002287581E|nr:glycosyltransferase [Phreatobacter sp. AB_2022a]MCZ0738389.1 glycosyltransferase [Phreatobacter sp. AB_2022a]
MTVEGDIAGRLQMLAGREILRWCYPAERLRLYVHHGSRPRPIRLSPGLIEAAQLDIGPVSPLPDLPPSDMSGHLHQGCPTSTAVITVSAAAGFTTSPHWSPRSWLARAAYHTSPLLFSQIRHVAERLQQVWTQARRPAAADHGPAPLSPAARPAPGSQHPALVFAVNWFEMGGAERFAFDCVKWALDDGFRVIVLPDRPSSHDHFSEAIGRRMAILRTDLHCDAALYQRLVLALHARAGVAAIHIHHSHRMYGVLSALRRLPDAPVTIDTTHIIEASDDCFVAASGRMTHLLDHHHVISDSLRETYRIRFGRTRNVHVGFLAPPFIDKPDDAFGIAHHKPTYRIGFVGRLTFQKRPFVFIYLAARLIKREQPNDPKLTFTVVGDGLLLDKTIALARRLGVADRIAFTGRTKDTSRTMADLDIVVLPSANEGLTLVAYEAWDAGVLPVATNVGAQGELVPDDLRGPVSPVAFIRFARHVIARLCSDRFFAAKQLNAFRAKRMDIATRRSGHDVVTGLYRTALRRH